jgi:hypothetical protein
MTMNMENVQDITMPVIRNMPTKLKWLQLGFFPTNESRIMISTLFPLFNPVCMQVLMSLWNTHAITAIPDGRVEINNGPALAEVG